MLNLDMAPYAARPLTLDGAAVLQRLCERCGDYYEIEEGAPAHSS